jgi:hypothetical protein
MVTQLLKIFRTSYGNKKFIGPCVIFQFQTLKLKGKEEESYGKRKRRKIP